VIVNDSNFLTAEAQRAQRKDSFNTKVEGVKIHEGGGFGG